MPNDVLTMFWFDTEDFVTPDSDDVPLQIARIMDRHNIKVTFKLVGEKLRTLEKRNRNDVIEAISHHEIGYHSDLHSVHPVINEYVGDLGWDEGSLEFEKREKHGVDDIKRIFGSEPSCYGQPGDSWVPQAYVALKKWNIPVYLDDTHTILPLNERPFYYCNVLNIMCLGQYSMALDASGGTAKLPDDWLIRLKEEYAKAYKKLESSDEIGLIGFYCHPTTYVTEEFWDEINYSHGINPTKPRIPKLKSKQRVEEDYKNLESFLKVAESMPRVHFITASQAMRIYEDKADQHSFTVDEVSELARNNLKAIYYYRLGKNVWVSPAEALYLILKSLVSFSEKNSFPDAIRLEHHPMGPKSEFHKQGREVKTVGNVAFFETCRDELSKITSSGYISPSISVGQGSVSPKDFFATCCSVYLDCVSGKSGVTISVKDGNFEVGKKVTDEGAKEDWSFYLTPVGFQAPMQPKLARLQAWTLKPAAADLSKL